MEERRRQSKMKRNYRTCKMLVCKLLRGVERRLAMSVPVMKRSSLTLEAGWVDGWMGTAELTTLKYGGIQCIAECVFQGVV